MKNSDKKLIKNYKKLKKILKKINKKRKMVKNNHQKDFICL